MCSCSSFEDCSDHNLEALNVRACMQHLKDGPDHYTTAFSVSPDHSGEGYLGPRGYCIRSCESASRIFMLKVLLFNFLPPPPR